MTPSQLMALAGLALGVVVGLTLRVGLAEVLTPWQRQRDTLAAASFACAALGLVIAAWLLLP